MVATGHSQKNTLMEGVEAQRDTIWGLSRMIHENPEVGFAEFKASRWVAEALEAAGYRVEWPVAGMTTALRATKSGGCGGPRVALLAEYDALPGIGHGCGHNFIAAATVGAAMALAPLLEGVRGEVIVLGCPAEEGSADGAGGKVILLEQGQFSGIDAAMMVHPSSKTIVRTHSAGRIALKVTFRGRAAHAASESNGINALDAAIETFNAWKRLSGSMGDDRMIHGIISQGGVSPNVIPDVAEIRVYLRCRSGEGLAGLETKAKACAVRAAQAINARVEFEYSAHTYLDIRPHLPLAARFERNLRRLGVKVDESRDTSMGSTDMGNVSHVVPSIHPYLSIGTCVPNGHTAGFGYATLEPQGLEATLTAAKALALTSWDVLTEGFG